MSTKLNNLENTNKPTRIIKKSQCNLISPTATGKLTYNIGFNDKTNDLFIRIITNSGGGFFSKEWISLENIMNSLEQQPKKAPFKALIFRSLYESRGSNNHGFLSAALRAEGILQPVEKAVYSHTFSSMKPFSDATDKLIQGDTALKDEVAIHEAKLAAQREAMAEKMKKAPKAQKSTSRKK